MRTAELGPVSPRVFWLGVVREMVILSYQSYLGASPQQALNWEQCIFKMHSKFIVYIGADQDLQDQLLKFSLKYIGILHIKLNIGKNILERTMEFMPTEETKNDRKIGKYRA